MKERSEHYSQDDLSDQAPDDSQGENGMYDDDEQFSAKQSHYPTTRNVEDLFSKWNELLKSFILNGFFRECKVIFKQDELKYKGPVFNRVRLHFTKGLPNDSDRFDLNMMNSDFVEEWWNIYGQKIVHRKLMEKKANVMMEIRKYMKGMYINDCNIVDQSRHQ